MDIRVGGGNDWIELETVELDHRAVGPNVANVSTCRVCRGGIVLIQGSTGWDDATWEHVVKRGSLNHG